MKKIVFAMMMVATICFCSCGGKTTVAAEQCDSICADSCMVDSLVEVADTVVVDSLAL